MGLAPEMQIPLLTLLVWAVGMGLVTGTLAAVRHQTFVEAAVRAKYLLTALGFVGAFHAMFGVDGAKVIAGAEVAAFVLLWLMASALPRRPADEESTPAE